MEKIENAIVRSFVQKGSIGRDSLILPDNVIGGCAKLLLLDESVIQNMFSKAEIKQLDEARAVMKQNKLDLKLIKSGLLLLIPLIRLSEEQTKKIKEFNDYISKLTAESSVAEVISKSLSEAVIPFGKLFDEGKSFNDIFEYQKGLRKKADEFDKEHADDEAKNEAKGKKDDVESKKALDNEQPKKISKEAMEKHTEKKVSVEKDKPEDIIVEEPKEVEVRNLDDLMAKYQKINAEILSVVKGQEAAVKKFVEGCFQGELFKQTERGNRPRSYFFFFGPPGTGKTLLAETAAEAFGIPFERYDMSDYNTNLSNMELIGTSDNLGRAQKGKLTSFVDKNPECILLFDEIEKASIEVIRMFLQILGSGALRDKKTDKLVSFKDAIIIFTSNVGSELYQDRSINLSTIPDRVLINAIREQKDEYGHQVLPNEICSRVAAGNTILFNHLGIRTLAELVNEGIERNVSSMEKEYECKITYSPQFSILLLFSHGSEIDARIATNKSNQFIRKEIYELTRQIGNAGEKPKKIRSIHFDIDYEGMDKDLIRLFKNDEMSEILVFGGKEIKDCLAGRSGKYKIHYATSGEKAEKLLANDITAIFIDPFQGKRSNNDTILSISDYNTEGIALFHSLTEKSAGIPIYMIDKDNMLSEVDKSTFIQEGAANIFTMDSEIPESCLRHLDQLMEEHYMEKESQVFSQRGYIIDFKSRQEICEDGSIKIMMYDLKKKMALDTEESKSILSDAERPNVKFDDIIGATKAIESLKKYIEYLKNPRKYILNGGEVPKGILLYGPPGTGKTMLAKAMAGESDVMFLEATAAGFKNKYVGESEANVRKLFANARKRSPAIIFIDEIDAIGRKRTGESPYDEGILNQLLTEMDGFASGDIRKPIIVIAATNYGVNSEDSGISMLDPALIQRFDEPIYIDLPNEAERCEYIRRELGKIKISQVTEEEIKNIAERTTGNSLREMRNIISAAKKRGLEKGSITYDDLTQALEDYIYGEKRETTPEYYKSVAIHETGHAFVSYMNNDKPSYITIESRGNHGGYMMHSSQENVYSHTKDDILGKIRTSLAGRAAEMVFYGKEKANNTGASSDLEHATSLAFRLLLSLGMEDNQLVVLDRKEVMQSSLAGEYIAKVNEILNTEMKNAIELIEKNKDTVQKIADVLVANNHLTGEEFDELVKKYLIK